MPKKTQEESEQPAKVYQLDAIAEQVGNLATQMKDGFSAVNTSVNALLVKTDSQVTPQQLQDNILALDKKYEDKIKESEDKIHLEYGPVKRTNTWLWRAIGAQGLIIFAQVVFLLYITGASK